MRLKYGLLAYQRLAKEGPVVILAGELENFSEIKRQGPTVLTRRGPHTTAQMDLGLITPLNIIPELEQLQRAGLRGCSKAYPQDSVVLHTAEWVPGSIPLALEA